MAFVMPALLSFSQTGNDTIAEKPYMKNTVYFEALGNGLLYSLNYDRILAKHRKFALAGRVGAARMPDINYQFDYTFPVEISLLYGKTNQFMEFGAGITFIDAREFSNQQENPSYTLNNEIVRYKVMRVGYRYQEPEGGFFFRAGLMYFMIDWTNLQHGYAAIPWGGISLGYTLKKLKVKS